MDEGGITNAQILDYDSCLPQGLKDIIPIVPWSNRSREEVAFEKVEVVGCWALTEKSIQLRERESRVATQRYHQWDLAWLVCAGERNCGWCVAGQCSHQCLKSIADQDKLSHSNKLHIPALIWPKYILHNINI